MEGERRVKGKVVEFRRLGRENKCLLNGIRNQIYF